MTLFSSVTIDNTITWILNCLRGGCTRIIKLDSLLNLVHLETISILYDYLLYEISYVAQL